jgi:hypothetical protein
MDDLRPDQRGALDALKTSRGSCPPGETLVEYEALAAADRGRHPAHDHISICSRCQLVLWHSAEPVKTTSSVRWFLPLAAVLVLGVAATVVWRAGAFPPAGSGVDTIRGTAIQPLAPIGHVETINEFLWQSPIRADRYRVRVTRGSDHVWSGETNALRIEAPAGVLDANIEYRWTVEALDREGDIRMTSPSQSFTWSRRR